MSQKSYMMEIVLALLRRENHIRGLAKEMGINQMTVSRKIKGLLDCNVVDFREEGRNKVFFLKRTIEARQHAYMAEHYKLARLVVGYPGIRKVVEGLQDLSIGMVLLFGSYAKGNATNRSDIDIYMESKDPKMKSVSESIDSRISAKLGAYDRGSLLIREIEKDHVVLKGVEAFYEKNRFFGQAENGGKDKYS